MIKNVFYFLSGIVFLILAKIKNILKGYSSPKPFSVDESERCINYDLEVVDIWLSHLEKYLSSSAQDFIKDKNILELGPGSDLGIGLYLLSKKVGSYNAVDVNFLIKNVPESFYNKFFDELEKRGLSSDRDFLKDQLDKFLQEKNDKLNYVCRSDFDVAKALGDRKIDLIVSQSAFEHFDDIESTIASLAKVTSKGSVAILQIDLKTHSRWITEKDPNNVYRYPRWFYNLFFFRGIPNRVRPYQYKDAFEKNGWENVQITPTEMISDDMFKNIKNYMSKEFRGDHNQMNYASIFVYATKK